MSEPFESLLQGLEWMTDEQFGEHVRYLMRTYKPKPATKPKAKQTDGEWLESLKADPTYAGIDVGREFGKCAKWCEVNQKQNTRKRFVNWLNRVEKPINGHQHAHGAPAGARRNFTETAGNAADRIAWLEAGNSDDFLGDQAPVGGSSMAELTLSYGTPPSNGQSYGPLGGKIRP